ncbi:choice-of-anchor D domain-containing protein [Marinilabilia rubra]|uniref:HYDIN/VesB/CFA65-like Ig-like domain-containing protein n=1 Tax=Marinilabilia rubra TaxID=2162893 RepID=A0A2U2BCA5_9BACT|nr:choice-of-anchor D domain-containing protein [Marinilabilia rubra]PWE00691.1 hypothetical protein DDZ16_03605 [Marinilabilia rubra]
MKIRILKPLACLMGFLLALMFPDTANAADLEVSGITSPSLANGTYTQQDNLFGYASWKMVNGSNTYYIYNDDFNGERYWNIDDNTIDDIGDEVIFYSTNPSTAASPAEINSWDSFIGATGMVVITEVGEPTVPEISVFGNGIEILDGDVTPGFTDHTKFGSADVSTGSVSRTYTIQNFGAGTLNISSVLISGDHASDFSIVTSPTSSVAGLGATSFSVDFNPSAEDSRNAIITVYSDDSDEGDYSFSVNGHGFSERDLYVSGVTTPSASNGNYIHQGVLNNYEYWKHETEDYYLYNDSEENRIWNLDVDLTGTNSNYLFFKLSDKTTPLSLTDWTNNTNSGNESSGAPFITEGEPLPEIDVKGNEVSIANGNDIPALADHTYFGVTEVNSGNVSRTFTIVNHGNADLALSGVPYVMLDGGGASSFEVTTQPSTTTIGSLSSVTFEVAFDPTEEGIKSASVTIVSNDPDEGTFTFSVSGEGIYPYNFTANGLDVPGDANGTYIYQGISNSFPYWKHQILGYYLYNDQYLTDGPFWNIDADLDDADVLFYSENPSEESWPGLVNSWTAEGTNSGTPVFAKLEPEIFVEGNLVEIANGDASPEASDNTDFGSVNMTSGSVSKTFAIKNTGNSDLQLTGSPIVQISGANQSDFVVSSQPSMNTVSTSGTVNFVVTFDPSEGGSRVATVSIANNDQDENPYAFAISGNSLVLPVVSTLSVSDITAISATGNAELSELGIPSVSVSGVCWSETSLPTVDDFKTIDGPVDVTGMFSSLLNGLSQNTTYYVRAYATNEDGTVYGDQVSFTTAVATGSSSLESREIALYPNPTKSGFYVDAGPDDAELLVTDLSGKVVHECIVSGSTYVPAENLPKGIYLVYIGGKIMKLIQE